MLHRQVVIGLLLVLLVALPSAWLGRQFAPRDAVAAASGAHDAMAEQTAFTASVESVDKRLVSHVAVIGTEVDVAALRSEGPAALDRLLQAWPQPGLEMTPQDQEPWQPPADVSSDEERQRRQAIDRVAGAKYAHLSGLYWYSDESAALAAAQRERKPLLTLRMLGRLDEEYSCANSRYFRQLLYPNAQIRKLLHDKFILAWVSLRPVPRLTVDMQNGCTLEQTITGNSVHYVLTPEGELVDVIPGLYAPGPFFERLRAAEAGAQRAMQSSSPANALAGYREQQLAQLSARWERDLLQYRDFISAQPAQLPTAERVGMAGAAPALLWEVLAGFHPEYRELDAATRERLLDADRSINSLRKLGEEVVNGVQPPPPPPDLAYTYRKGSFETPYFSELAQCVARDLACDTVKNEYFARYQALAYLHAGAAQQAVAGPTAPARQAALAQFNAWVYRELLGYDIEAPWAGMERLASYAALPLDGLSLAPPADCPVKFEIRDGKVYMFGLLSTDTPMALPTGKALP